MDKIWIEFSDGQGGFYVSCTALVWGDYGGSGSVGAANIRYLTKQHSESLGYWADSYQDGEYTTNATKYVAKNSPLPSPVDVAIARGSYNFHQAWVKESVWFDSNYDLDGYPVFDDETLSEVEDEWIQEAWNDYGKKEVYKMLEIDLDSLERSEEEKAAEVTLSSFLGGEGLDMFATCEYSSAYIDSEELVKKYRVGSSAAITMRCCQRRGIYMQLYDLYRFTRNKETGAVRRYLVEERKTLEWVQNYYATQVTAGETRKCDWAVHRYPHGVKFF